MRVEIFGRKYYPTLDGAIRCTLSPTGADVICPSAEAASGMRSSVLRSSGCRVESPAGGCYCARLPAQISRGQSPHQRGQGDTPLHITLLVKYNVLYFIKEIRSKTGGQ